MRKILFTRGYPGSGKSRFINVAGLEEYVLSTDKIRLMLSSPIMTETGDTGISQEFNPAVWSYAKNFIEEKMKRGEFIVFDATFIKNEDIKPFLKMADLWGYEKAVFDFTDMNIEMIKERNLDRENASKVPTHVIDKMVEENKKWQNPSDVFYHKIGSWTLNFKKDLEILKEWSKVPVENFSHYENIHHIGDLQGCNTVLTENLNYNEKDLYVFVGDLIDRGIENGDLIKSMVELCKRDNVIVLWGNHEDHLWRFYKDLEPVSDEFKENTLPQLKRAQITKEDLKIIFSKTREVLLYKFHDKNIMVTHAGLSDVPKRPELISKYQYTKGVGTYEYPIDKQFKNSEWIQIHGHRNSHSFKQDEFSNSINLEDSVEFGGYLRISSLSKDGWKHNRYKNKVFKPYYARKGREMKIKIDWLGTGTKIDPQLIKDFREHKMSNGKKAVREVYSVKFPHVSSFNFSKDVFFDKAWDDLTSKARGFFADASEIDKGIVNCVSRSYDKFFNENEREETKIETLVETLQFPLYGYLKENGYLGILGYDEKQDELFISSKSSTDTDFALWFEEMLLKKVDKKTDKLKRDLHDLECSMTFEVIDPVKDPHIIKYSEPQIVLLDIIHRGQEFKKAPYDIVKEIGEKYGFKTKERVLRFQNKEQFLGWYNKSKNNMDFKQEGIVFEDQKGFHFKWKSPYYQFWKHMRGMKDAISAGRIPYYVDTLKDEGLNFYIYASLRDKEFLPEFKGKGNLKDTNIIELREDYISFKNNSVFGLVLEKYEDWKTKFNKLIKDGKVRKFNQYEIEKLTDEEKEFYDFISENDIEKLNHVQVGYKYFEHQQNKNSPSTGLK